MKTRTGFVSNSSSSSFIVGFKGPCPDTEEGLRAVLYPNGQETLFNPYSSGPTGYPISQVVQTIFEAFSKQSPMTPGQILEEIEKGYFEGYPAFPEWKKGETREQEEARWDEYRKQTSKAAQALFDRDFPKLLDHGYYFYTVEFSDNDSEYYSTLEHGDTFEYAAHVTVISHH